MLDSQGRRNKLAIVQYIFHGSPIKVLVKPHGNSKGKSPYFRNSTTAFNAMKSVATTKSPKEVIAIMTNKEGGELYASPSDVPRNRQQISNIRRKQKEKHPDVLYSIMLQCKLAEGSSDAFVRDVKAAPSPQSVLFFNWQLEDMARFLTNNCQFGVLTVDTTYNLGAFYVTPMTYSHLLLEDVKSGMHPILMGPLLVHQQKNFVSFNYFCSTVIGYDRRLRNIMAFGTDGDASLIESLSHAFPFAVQLRCTIHFKRNLEEKLKSSGYPSIVITEFLEDIFGCHTGTKDVKGLIDTEGEGEFESFLCSCEEKWNEIDRNYLPSAKNLSFYPYFCKYYKDVLKFNMRRDVRESAGLGSPPVYFTTNAAESINATLKRKVDYKESEWPEFIKIVKDLVESQRQEVIRSLSGRGQYRLLPQYNHLGVTVQQWTTMNPDQRKKLLDSFDKASLIVSVNDEIAASDQSTTTVSLPISPEDSGITTLPIVTLQGMWKKANDLLSTDNAITKAPGTDPKARMVLSYSSLPHLVRSGDGGKYQCDSNCLQWSSCQVCSHCLAAAHDNDDLPQFLTWYTSGDFTPNITKVGMHNTPSGSGRKGGKQKRHHSRQKSDPVWNISKQQSVLSSNSNCDMVLPGLQVTQSQTVTTPPQQLQSHPFCPSSHMQYWPQGQMQPF